MAWRPLPAAWRDPSVDYPPGRAFTRDELPSPWRRSRKPLKSDRDVRAARELWKSCAKYNRDPARDYIDARGVDVSQLRLGELPASIRYHPRLPCFGRDDRGQSVELGQSPAVVCAVSDLSRPENDALVGCLRIFLERDRPQRRGDIDPARPIGKLAGGAVRLDNGLTHADRFPDGSLVLCVGVETGLAILSATGLATWACVSLDGLKAIELPRELVGGPEPLIRQVIIAVDRGGEPDAYRASLFAARRLRQQFGTLPISIATPADADGADSATWLDVLVHRGVEGVLRGLARGLDLAVSDAKGRDGADAAAVDPFDLEESDGPILPRGSLARARVALGELWTPPNPAGLRWNVAYHFASDRWLEWRGTHYQTVSPTELRASMLARFERYCQRTKRGTSIRVAMSARQCGDVLDAMIADVGVLGEQLPCWAPPVFDERGRASYTDGARPVAVTRDAEPGSRTIPYLNGLLRLDTLLSEGRVVVDPASNRYVIPYCLPYAVPEADLAAAMKSAEHAAEVFNRLCPRWMQFLTEVSGGDDRWISCLGRFLGYCMTDDTRFQKALFLVGQPGSGKGTILDVLHLLVGSECVLSSSFKSLTERFEMGALVGKLVLQLDEAAVGWSTDSIEASRVFKTLTGGAMITPEHKHKGKGGSYRPAAKMIATSNELPKLPETSGATSRRILILPFNTSFEGRSDPQLRDKLASEIAGICVWALLHLVALYRDGVFPEPADSVELKEDFRRLASPVYAFTRDCCVFEPRSEVDTQLLLALFKAWCDAENMKSMSAEKFGTMLRVVNSGVRSASARDRRAGRRFRVYRGVRPRVPSDNATDGREPEEHRITSSADCDQFEFPFEWQPLQQGPAY